jgi:hypothetical protein
VKKVLLVGLLGGIVLVVTLWALRRDRDVAATVPGAGSPSVTGVPSVATAAPIAPAATAPTIAPAPATPPMPMPMSDPAACARLADLCSTSDEKVDTDACVKKLGDARKMSGSNNVDRSELCLTEAKTCAAASGCLSGGVGVGAAGEFLKGLGAALSK